MMGQAEIEKAFQDGRALYGAGPGKPMDDAESVWRDAGIDPEEVAEWTDQYADGAVQGIITLSDGNYCDECGAPADATLVAEAIVRAFAHGFLLRAALDSGTEES